MLQQYFPCRNVEFFRINLRSSLQDLGVPRGHPTPLPPPPLPPPLQDWGLLRRRRLGRPGPARRVLTLLVPGGVLLGKAKVRGLHDGSLHGQVMTSFLMGL